MRSKVELECLATRLREEMHVTTKDPIRIHQTAQTELVGDYNLKARELYDLGRISQAKYFSLLTDMGIIAIEEEESKIDEFSTYGKCK